MMLMMMRMTGMLMRMLKLLGGIPRVCCRRRRLVVVIVVSVVVFGCVSGQEDQYGSPDYSHGYGDGEGYGGDGEEGYPGMALMEGSSCHGDHTDDLEAGLGLLAEQRVVVTVRRSSVSLHCALASGPQFGNLSYVWKVRGETIQSRSPRGRRYTFPNGTLHIRKVVHRTKGSVRMSDEGLYQCYVTNDLGTVIAQRIRLVVASLGKTFVTHPVGGTHNVGDNVFLACHIHSSPPDLMVVWQKDGSLLHIEHNARYRPLKHGLLLLDVGQNDSGTYHCQVTNKNFFTFVHDDDPSPVTWRNSQPATLTVTPGGRGKDDPPVSGSGSGMSGFLLRPDNVTEVLMGDSVDLLCVTTIFSPGLISWTHADASEPDVMVPVEESAESAEFSLLPCGSLRIKRASRHLAGIYSCAHRTTGLSLSTVLHVLEEPVIEDSSPSCVYPLASIVRLDCLAGGSPPPSLMWLKNGEQVEPVRYRVEFLREALVIYQGNTGDSGYYQCLVQNKAGWALSLARVAVRIEPDAPAAPRNVSGEAVSSSRIQVTWEMDPASSNLVSYSIHRRLAMEEGGEEAEIIGGQRQEAVLYGLSPDTLYAVTIRAYNRGGASPASDPVYIRTDLTGYPSPALSYTGNASVLVDWSDFHQRHRRKEDIREYQVVYGLSNSPQLHTIVLDATQHSLPLSDLEENREYRVRMKALFKGDNSDIHDESWRWSYIRTGNASLPTVHSHLAAPYNLHAVPLEPSAIAVSWTYSADSLPAALPVTHYTVRCQMMDTSLHQPPGCQDSAASSTEQSVMLKTSHSNMATLDELKAFTLYNISVSAHSDSLQGPYSRPILVQTKEDVPSRPENLEAEVVSEGQVRLQWQPPTLPNGLIQGHYIQYINQQYTVTATTGDLVNSTWVQLYQRGNKTQAMVGQLTQRFYVFQVQACTNAGRGEPSTLVFVHMGGSALKGGLSDQHLGILGGSVIGLTSIIITVIVIVCKQRQLKKQLDSQYLMDQRRQLSAPTPDLHSPGALTLKLTPSTTRSEELEKLLHTSGPYNTTTTPSSIGTNTTTNTNITTSTNPNTTSAATADTDSRDSGCSSIPVQMEDSAVDNNNMAEETGDVGGDVGGDVVGDDVEDGSSPREGEEVTATVLPPPVTMMNEPMLPLDCYVEQKETTC